MKRVFIVHRWAGSPKTDWYSWLKEELEKKGFEVHVPKMPFDEPKIEESVACLKKAVGKSDNETFFVGHSIGCQTIMRFLDKSNSPIGGAVFVAGWFKLDNLEDAETKEIAAPWTADNINFAKLKSNLDALTVFISSNEPYNFIEENSKTFKEKLNAKIIIEKNKGHFTEDDKVTEVPSILKEVLKIAC